LFRSGVSVFRSGVSVFSNAPGMMTNPFSDNVGELLNFATGAVLPSETADKLLSSTDKGG